MSRAMKMVPIAVLCALTIAAPSAWAYWIPEGVPVSTAATSQMYPQIASDGAGGALVTWDDYRGGSGNADIYAQRVNASGVAQWTAGGVALCTAGGSRAKPMILSDGAGGAFVTWYDYRSGNADIYA